jgi:ribosomal protein L37AE/L43A
MSRIGSVFNQRTGTTTTYFETIERKRKIKKKCSSCGKDRIRTISASQTVNPFNRNKDGSVKSRAQVIESVAEELERQVEKFERKKFTCNTCSLGVND